VILWDVRQAAAGETLTGHAGTVSDLAVTRDGATLYSASLDGTVLTWDLVGARRLGRPFRAGTGYAGFPRYALSSDGRLIALGQGDGAISIVDARTLARRRPFPVTTTGEPLHDDLGVVRREVLGMRFLPGSHLLVVGGFEGFLALVDADSGRVLRRLRGHRGPVFTPPGISADGRLMVTGSYDRTVRFWSLPEGRALGAPLRFERPPGDTQLSPDGRWVVIANETDTLEIWDARTHRLARRVRGREGIFFARFSPDGRLLAVGDTHGRAEVWSTRDWKPVTRAFGGHAGRVDLGAISPDNRTLATGATDGTVRLWDIETQQPIGAPLAGLPERRVIPFFTPDGTGLIAAYDTGRAYRWDIRPASLARHACRVAGRRLTRAEWDEFLPGRDYEPAC